jgi:hypothetical protein
MSPSDKNDRPGPTEDPTLSPSHEAHADEIGEAEHRRDAVSDGRDPFVAMLAAAVRPTDLSDEEHDRILEAAFARVPEKKVARPRVVASAEEPIATETEKVDAERLRVALEADARDQAAEHPLAELARATRNAHSPKGIDDIRNESLLRPALRAPTRSQSRRFITASIAGALAVAAGVFGLWLRTPADEQPAAELESRPTQLEYQPGMTEVRSTTDLFAPEDFPKTGGERSRIDRITQKRKAELRDNRFVAWGIP